MHESERYLLKLDFHVEISYKFCWGCIFSLIWICSDKGSICMFGFEIQQRAVRKCRVYTNRQVVGVNEGLIALALLKGQKEMSLGMSCRESQRP